MPNFSPRELEGWGRFPRQSCRVARPEKRRALLDLVASDETRTVLPRGLGRAYGDAALAEDEGVLMLEKLDRFLDFDSDTGVLHVESGVSNAQIIETFVPRGWFLPVVPGTKFIAVGGALAADVHGKNHHRVGTIAQHVEEFELLLASGETIVCSRTQNSDAFRATLGGMGLTGVILSAKLRLQPIESAQIVLRTERTRNLQETLDGFGRDSDTTYSVAWIDCLAAGEALGRSVFLRGEHATNRDLLAADFEGDPFASAPKKAKNVPRDFPDFALSPASVRAFNAAYYAGHPDGEELQGFEKFFWPLDSLGNWNKIYGARGFVQYHCILPFATSGAGLTRLLERIAGSGRAAFLAVLKLYGPENDSPMSFPLEGHSLALDLPASEGIVEFCRELDAITLEHGGRTYLAKDSTLAPDTFHKMYPRLPEFERIKRELDPRNRFQSSLSRRLHIGGAA